MKKLSQITRNATLTRTYDTVFVGGGGRGIGRAIALALAAQGFKVTVAARTRSELEEVRDCIEEGKGTCKVAVVDLTIPDATAIAIREVHQEFGSLAVLVNCAGAHPTNAPVEDYPVDYWNELIAINLSSIFYACRSAVPLMKQQRYGRIINISSVAGEMGVPNACGYVAAKHGVLGFTKALAVELGAFGITVNAICPGFVETRMTAAKDRLRAFALERAALHRVVDAREVASLAAYLVSEDGGAITGQTLNVCAGLII